jgi:PAS domain S-box-containing protein
MSANKKSTSPPILRFAPSGYFLLDRDGIICELNQGGARLLNEDRSAILSNNFRKYISPAYLPTFNQFLEKIFSQAPESVCELELTPHNHSNLTAMIEGFVTENQERLVINVEDITHRKRSEELLKINEERFRQLIENSFDMIVLLDINGYQTYVSDSCFKILGYRPDELINIPVIDQMIHPDDKEYLISEFHSAIERGFGGVQYRHKHKNGGWVYLEAFGTNQLSNPAINALVLNVRDITERKLAEEALKEKEATLRELNATKDRFFSIIAHDLKSPFHSIIGYSNMALKQIQEKNYAEIEKYASVIQKSAQQTMNLLLNLLDWSRAQTGMLEFNPETIEPDNLLNEIMPIFKGAAQQKSINISRKVTENNSIVADKAMVNTIIRNLISNAIKFTHPGGKILISVSQNNRQTIFTVSDNGVGIPETAFTKLFRIDQNYSTRGTLDENGTGLGLIICKTFVEKHGGKLWFENNTNHHPFKQGTSFHFSIPEKNKVIR